MIGWRKFVYDLEGDSVNIASRMETQGLPRRIQITELSYTFIQGEFECKGRGSLPVKGQGDLMAQGIT